MRVDGGGSVLSSVSGTVINRMGEGGSTHSKTSGTSLIRIDDDEEDEGLNNFESRQPKGRSGT
jgi:hypothetical protein